MVNIYIKVMRKASENYLTLRCALLTCLILKFIVLPVAAWGQAAASQIAAGWGHNIALKSDGTVWTWGLNEDGQLGDGTTVDRYIPFQIGTDNTWVSITAGYIHTIALKSDGTLWAWGHNLVGQLGDGTTTNRRTPVQIGTENTWVSAKSGLLHTLAQKSDGSLWAWGRHRYGQLGYSTTETCGTYGYCSTSPMQIGVDTDWVLIAGGGYHSISLKSDGTLWAWGLNSFGELGYNAPETCTTSNGDFPCSTSPVQVGMDSDWVSIAGGEHHTLALKSNGTLWAWGRNDLGQLGFNSTETCSDPWWIVPCTTSPAQVGTDTDWALIATDDRHSLALKSDGTLWAWGRNDFGQLGDGTTTNKPTPVQIGPDNTWISVAGGGNHTVALKTDTLWAWGRNDHGQVGDGTATHRYSPVLIMSTDGCQNPDYPVSIMGTPPAYFFSIQNAYNASSEGDTIQIQAMNLVENINFGLNKTVILEGGLDCYFTNQIGKTIINGTVIISNGKNTIENIILE
jgi:alpha-tubulin suppressor-like RCC1 family protein